MTDSPPVCVGLYGEFQVGKSLLVNCLLEHDAALVGDGFSTTPFPVTYHWGEIPGVELLHAAEKVGQRFASPEDFVDHLRKEHASTEGQERLRRFHEARVSLPLPKLRQVALVDLPGFNGDEADDSKANEWLAGLHFVVFVTRNKELMDEEKKALRRIKENQLPISMVLNCYDSSGYPSPTDLVNKRVAGVNFAHVFACGVQLVKLAGTDVLLVNAAWHRPARVQSADDPEEQQQQNADFVQQLHDFVFPEPERSVGANAPCLARFHRAVREWADQAKEQVGKIRSTINNNH